MRFRQRWEGLLLIGPVQIYLCGNNGLKEDGTMRRCAMVRILTFVMLLVLFVGVLQARDRMSFRAASSDPVAGWQRMTLEDKVVWVSPEVSLTSADVSRAQPIAQPDGKK